MTSGIEGRWQADAPAPGNGHHADRMVYRWDRNLLGTADLGPVASSLAGNEMYQLHEVVGPRVRMTDAGDLSRPSSSLCHLRFDERAIALRRLRGGTDNRDDVTEVLIGRPDFVSARLALAMPALPAPDRGEEFARPLHSGDVADAVTARRQRLSQSARTIGTPLVVLLAAALETPDASFAVLAQGGWEGQSTQPDVLTWGLLEIVERVCAGLHIDHWTFSTYEATYHDGIFGLPRVVFAPDGVRESQYGTSRRAVHPLETLAFGHDDAHRAARLLVDWYTASEQRLIDELDQRSLHEHATLDERLAVLAGVAPGPVPLRRRPTVPLPAEHRRSTRVPSSPAPPVPAVEEESQMLGSLFAPPAAERGPLDWERELAEAESPTDVQRTASRLERYLRTGPPLDLDGRRRLLEALVKSRFHWEKLHRSLGAAGTARVLDMLMPVAIGQDLADRRTRWTFLGDRTMPPAVVHAIARFAVAQHCHESLLLWLGVRWLSDAGMPVPDPAPMPDERPAVPERRGVYMRLWRSITSPNALRVAVVVGGATLLLFLLFAVLVRLP